MATDSNGDDSPLAGHRPINGEPHPDVYIIQNVLEQLKPGEEVAQEVLCKSIGLTLADWKVVQRRVTRARSRLRREGVNIVAVRGKGYIREMPLATTTRVMERERGSLRRKATKALQELGNVDTGELDQDQRYQHGAATTIMAVCRGINTVQAKRKTIAALQAKPTIKRLPMA